MNTKELKKLRPIFLMAAILGFLFISCPFLYYAVIAREVYEEGMKN